MVVPEKILMRKIKKREKVKKQISASKRVRKSSDQTSIVETKSESNQFWFILLFQW